MNNLLEIIHVKQVKKKGHCHLRGWGWSDVEGAKNNMPVCMHRLRFLLRVVQRSFDVFACWACQNFISTGNNFGSYVSNS